MNKKPNLPQINLTVPCHWNNNVINKILNTNHGVVRIAEVYGVLSDGCPVGHGRAKNTVVSMSREKALNFRLYLKKIGLKFTYLLNAPFHFNSNQEQLNKLDEYLNWIINILKPDALTISSLDLMKYIRKTDSKIPIYISTIAGIKSVRDLKPFMDIKPSRVIPHHDIGKRWHELKELIEYGRKNLFSVEMMATESCLFECPNRNKHYKYLIKETKDSPFHSDCNSKKLTYPREYLLAGGIIRPEDIVFYKEMGVNFFKITGRSQSASWLPKVVKAYQKMRHRGNLIRLLDINPAMHAEKLIYLDNNSLDGFLRNFPQTGYQDAVKYCDEWMVRLYNKKKFKISDQSIYSTEGNSLILKKAGKRVSAFFD